MLPLLPPHLRERPLDAVFVPAQDVSNGAGSNRQILILFEMAGQSLGAQTDLTLDLYNPVLDQLRRSSGLTMRHL